MRYNLLNNNNLRRLFRGTRWMWLFVLLITYVVACGSANILTLRSTKPQSVEIVPVPQLKEYSYKKVLLLPPQDDVEIKDLKIDTILEKDTHYYTTKVEKSLLKQGFQVISPEIVARVNNRTKAKKDNLSIAEKAMIMGKETKADAVFLLQSVNIRGLYKYFVINDKMVSVVKPGQVRTDEDGEYFHADTGQCLYGVPYYELRIESKLVDSASGNVLWVGSGKQTSIDVATDDWVAKLNDDCEVLDHNYIYGDYLKNEETLAKTVNALLKRLIDPLAKDAFDGKIIAHEPKVVAAPPPPKKKEEPKTKKAVVSSRRALLRSGPSKRNSRKMKVPRKTKLEVLEEMGEWIKVKVQDGTEGWLHESTVIISD